MASWQTVARQAAQRYGINPGIFVAQINQESGGRDVTSGAGAVGPAQFLPSTGAGYGLNSTTIHELGPSLDAAARLMRDNLRKYGSYQRALSAYNSGKPDAYKDPNFAGGQTYNYVKTILGAAGGAPSTTAAPPRASKVSTQTTHTTTTTTPGVDNSALRRQLIGDFLNSGGVRSSNATLALAQGWQAAQDVPGTTSTKTSRSGMPVTPPRSTPSTSADVFHEGGTVMFDGKPVAKWVGAALSAARANGWRGTVNSGYRSDAEQTRIYQSGVRPAAVPRSMGGAGSNHEFTVYPGGAVDVSDPQGLVQALKRTPYAKKLIYAGAKDPVHFSHPHNGSY